MTRKQFAKRIGWMGKVSAKPALEPYQAWVQSVLSADEQSPPKQRHTAQSLYERLKIEFGYIGSERSIRRLVAELTKKTP